MPHSLNVAGFYVLDESAALTGIAVGDYLKVNPARGHEHSVYLLIRVLSRQEAERVLATVDYRPVDREHPHLELVR